MAQILFCNESNNFITYQRWKGKHELETLLLRTQIGFVLLRRFIYGGT